MQKMPFRSKPDSPPSAAAAVCVVAHHWVTDRREVANESDGFAGVQMRTQQVSRSSGLDERSPMLLAVIDDCHARSVSRVPGERFLDGERVAVEVAPDHHGVPAPHAPAGSQH